MYLLYALCFLLTSLHWIHERSFVFGKVENLDKYCPTKDFTFAIQNWCPANGLQVHGLWPNYRASCPCSVEKEKLNLDFIDEQIFEELEKEWRACGQNNIDLWDHEWQKHGICLGWSENEYFLSSLLLYREYKDSCIPEKNSECKIKLTNEEVNKFFLKAQTMIASGDETMEDDVIEDDGSIAWKIFAMFILLSLFAICSFCSLQQVSRAFDTLKAYYAAALGFLFPHYVAVTETELTTGFCENADLPSAVESL